MKKSFSATLGIALMFLMFLGCKSTQDTTATIDEVTTPTPPATPSLPGLELKAQDMALLEDVPFDPEVRKGVLPNGLTYYIRKNAKPENFAELRLAVNAGAIQEDEDQQGLAHFVEHMAFNGTKNFPKSALVDFLESIGVKFGAHLNAYTSFDETVYMLRVPTDSAELFDKGMQILEDWAHNVSFEGEEIEKERGVVIEEWRLGLGAGERMRQKTLPVSFYNSRYAKRLPIGKQEILESFDHETLRRFYKDWYRPDLMALIAVGDFDPNEVEKMIKEKFGRIPASESPRKREYSEMPDHADTKIVIASDPEASRGTVQLEYKHDKKTIKTLKDYRSSIASQLCNQMIDARLEELTKSANPPFSYAFTGYSGMVRTKDSYSAYAMVPEGKHVNALESLLIENERAFRHGFTQSELDRQKSTLITRAERQQAEKDKTESGRLIWTYVRNYLSQSPVISSTDRLKFYNKFLPEITLAEVNERFKSWVIENNRVIVMDGPEKEGVEMPDEEQVKAILAKVKKMPLEPYLDEVIRAPLMSARPEPAKIISENKIESLGITEITYENGAKVILKPTDFKNDEISLNAYSPGGHSLIPDEKYMSANFATQIISSSGIGPYNSSQMEKFLSDKAVRIRPYISELEEGFQGSSSIKDQEVMLQMLHLYFTNPNKDATAFQSTMNKTKGRYANILSNPTSYFRNETNKITFNEHPRRGFPTPEKLDQVKLDDAYAIFKDRFGDISDFTFIFVGNIDMETLKPMLGSYIGSIPATNRKETWRDVEARITPGKINKSFKKGKEPQSAVNLIFHGDFEWGLDNSYKLKSMVSVLRIMLRESLREEKGGVYGVRCSANTARYPVGKYRMDISFQCAPENAEDLIQTAMKDIRTLQKEGASEKELVKVKETQRKDIETGMKENGYWMRQLKFAYSNELDMAEDMKKSGDRIEKLTGNDVKDAANQYIDMNNFIKATLYPEVDN
ncbi:insulinase family protein [bacterium]|nr:insulinase family protein [bacterium]